MKITVFITTILLALISGLFYSYSCSVNPGLNRLNDMEYLRAMQSINRAILNPMFFLSFMGTLVMLPLSTWLYYRSMGINTSCYYFGVAALLYVFGVFGITMFGNVPLNNALDKFDIVSATAEELKQQRAAFEGPWNRLHTIRTVVVVLSLILFTAGLFRNYRV